MKTNFSLTETQKEKVTALQKAFADCKEAGVDFIVTNSALLAFQDPGIQIARPYLGDDYPDEDAGEIEVTDELFQNTTVVTQNFGYADQSEDIVFLSKKLK